MYVASPQNSLGLVPAPEAPTALEEVAAPAPIPQQAVDTLEVVTTSASRQWAFVDAARAFPADLPENTGDGLDGLRGAKNAIARFAQAEYRCLCPCFCK